MNIHILYNYELYILTIKIYIHKYVLVFIGTEKYFFMSGSK